MLDELSLIVLRGIGIGGMFGLLALSLNVIYNATHILNFAQGGMFVLGGLLGILASPAGYGSLAWAGAWVGSAVAIGALMAVQGWLTLLPLRHSTQQHSWLITTLAVSIIIGALLLLTQGPWSSQFAGEVPAFAIRGMRTSLPYLVLPLAALAWLVALAWFVRGTLTGLALSALSQDLDAAAAAGLKVRRLQIGSFALSGLIVGSAGFAAAPIISVTPDAGIRYVVAGFVAAVVGGMGSMGGAVVAGPLIGVASMYAVFTFGGKYESFVLLLILTVVLFIRPSGLFGVASARRV